MSSNGVAASSAHTDFLASGGQMGKFIGSMDWSKTPLGPIESWPQSLRTTVSLCLASNFPISIAWGPQRTQIYNDGYWPICAAKHPHSMGQDFRECWFSAWPAIGEAFERASAGEAAFIENQRMYLDRYGYLEETFFTFSFSPIRDESGSVAGLFHPVTEMTQQTLSERRLKVVRDLADGTAEAKKVDLVCELIPQTLARHELDVPFALLYLLDHTSNRATLAGCAGLKPGSIATPQTLDLTQQQSGWPISNAVRQRRVLLVDDLKQRFGTLTCGPYPESPHAAYLLPITVSGIDDAVAVLVAGVSSRRVLDDPYRTFYLMLREAATNAITNARSYEEERKRAEKLAELDRAKTAFFTNVSHEFRTPLTLMLGPIEEWLAEGAGDTIAAEKKHVEVVYRNTLRLLKLVNTMLDFSRIEAGRVQACFEEVDLAEYTTELASNFRSACEKAGLELDVDCESLPESVYVDRDMWEKVVLNLLSNAFKFTFEGGIEVRLAATDGFARLTVRDTGVGIPADELPRVFERFHRVERSQGRTHEGTGIGLALVQELAKLHGGSVHAESRIGEGSQFTVLVPLGKHHLDSKRIGAKSELVSTKTSADAFVQEALRWLPEEEWGDDAEHVPVQLNQLPSDSTGELAAESGNRSRLARIVWADDNADMREYVKRLLSTRFQVEPFADGQAALNAIRADPPDLVLSDVMMPKLDGFGLLRALRTDRGLRDIPVILLSARAGEEARIDGMQAGADDYLIKPFSARDLLARVESHVKMARFRHETEASLRQREHHLQAIIENTPECVKIVAADGKLLQINPAGLAMVEAEAAETVVGRSVYGLIAPEQREAFREFHERVCRGETGALEFDIIGLHGRRRQLETHAVPLRQDDGQFAQLALTRDITERKRSEQALRESYDELYRFNRAAVDRELRMIELKREINALRSRLGEPAQYSLDFDQNRHALDTTGP